MLKSHRSKVGLLYMKFGYYHNDFVATHALVNKMYG